MVGVEPVPEVVPEVELELLLDFVQGPKDPVAHPFPEQPTRRAEAIRTEAIMITPKRAFIAGFTSMFLLPRYVAKR